MQLHELGLPVRIPAEVAVRGVLSRGQHYNLRARQGKRLAISLAQVSVTKPGRPPLALAEELVTSLLAVTSLSEPGQTWAHPDHEDMTDEELDAGEASGHLAISWRAARVVGHLLAVRARMRTELGMN
jgi:hypothetical protein